MRFEQHHFENPVHFGVPLPLVGHNKEVQG